MPVIMYNGSLIYDCSGEKVLYTDELPADAEKYALDLLNFMENPGAEILRLEKLFSERYKGIIGVFRSEEFFLELVPLGIDKAKSIDVLLEKLGLTSKQCIACGDAYNDITMIQYAGLGVAMGNAVDEVKEAADIITDTNDQDGVAKVVEEYMI